VFVTQSTVSARIQSLEEQLECRLFERNVGTPTGYRASLTIGGRFGIWDDLLVQSLTRIRSAAPDIAIRTGRNVRVRALPLLHRRLRGRVNEASRKQTGAEPAKIQIPAALAEAFDYAAERHRRAQT
jgi:regulatory helix-turn-helix LysR family protein